VNVYDQARARNAAALHQFYIATLLQSETPLCFEQKAIASDVILLQILEQK
jgi:hypothetical protein